MGGGRTFDSLCDCSPHTPPTALVSTGSPDLTNSPVTVALTPASSHTSARCVKKSLPAATTYPNTRRSTVAPGPAGLSEPPCDTFNWPKPCPALPPPTLSAQAGFWPGWGPGLPQDFWCFTSRTFFRKILRADCCFPHSLFLRFPLLPAVYFSLVWPEQLVLYRANSHLRKSGFPGLPTLTHTHTHTHTDIKQNIYSRRKSYREAPLFPPLFALLFLLPNHQVLLRVGWGCNSNWSVCNYIIFLLLLHLPVCLEAKLQCPHGWSFPIFVCIVKVKHCL